MPSSEMRRRVTLALIGRPDCDVNAADSRNSTTLHLAITNLCVDVFEALFTCDSLDLNVRDADGHTPLALYLLRKSQTSDNDGSDASSAAAAYTLDDGCMASRLIQRGCMLDVVDDVSGM